MVNMKKRFLSFALAVVMLFGLIPTALAADTTTTFPNYYTTELDYSNIDAGLNMTDAEIDAAIEALLNTMTIDEKYSLLGGNGQGSVYGNAGYLLGVPRLGVPESRMHDGPSGVLSLWPTTNTPDRQMAAATWDDDLIEDYGEVYGSENRAIGSNMQLGAQYDITRTPEFGRANDQYGEDQYLLARLAAAETKGIQSQGVVAVAKHYAAFAQSASPAAKTDIAVSEQALHETYLAAFEAAVKDGGLLGMMSSYNSINGTLASSNTYLQLDVLRDMWGYRGLTVTDWGGNDGYTLNKGTDIEMPSLSGNNKAAGEAAISDPGELLATVNNATGNVLYALGHAGYLALVETYTGADGKLYAKEETGRTEAIKLYADSAAGVEAVQDENNSIVLDVARGGGVLLENKSNALPIADDGSESIAAIGTGGKYTLSGTGGERSYGVGYEMTSPYESLKSIVGASNVSLEPVFDNGGSAIPAANLYYDTDGSGTFAQGYELANNSTTTPVTGRELEYLPAANSFVGGDSFAKDASADNTYTFTTYIKPDTTGDYTIIMHGIGGSVSAVVSTTDTDAATQETKNVNVSYASSQGTQWHSGDYCTDTGMSISSGVTVSMDAGKYYKVVITGIANRSEKNLQLRLAWLTPETSVSYDSRTDTLSGGAYDNALALAANNDKVVVFVDARAEDMPNTRDADNLNVSAKQERLILDVAAAAHNVGNEVIVVINNETAITIHNWVDEADAILMMYRPGQKGGQATAELLTGIVNPSGKLAYTMPMNGNETIISYSDENFNKQEQPSPGAEEITLAKLQALTDGELLNYYQRVRMDLQMRMQITDSDTFIAVIRGTNTSYSADMAASIVNSKINSGTVSYYDEGILTGYRWYDANNVTPRYDFGYGLSYTTFEYSDLSVTANATNGDSYGYDVTFTVTNTGAVAGSEVAQVYLGQADTSLLPSGIQSAPVQLVGYVKIKDLAPGASSTKTIHLDQRALSYWDSTRSDSNLITNADGSTGKWTVAKGARTIYVGAASDDLILSKSVTTISAGNSGGNNNNNNNNSNNNNTTPDNTSTLPFSDVSSNSWFYDAVEYVYEEGLMSGTSTTTFEPNAKVTRAMLVTVLYNLEGKPAVSGTSKFADVGANAWYTNAVIWATKNGIVSGYSDTKFGTNDTATREQTASIFLRYANWKGIDTTEKANLSSYTDSGSISAWALGAMQWANAAELITGTSTTTLSPRGTSTRAQLASILARFAENLS